MHSLTLDPARIMKVFLTLGVIFGVILLAGGILALGMVLYAIWTMPLMVLVDHVFRFALISLVLYIVARMAWPVVRSFRLS